MERELLILGILRLHQMHGYQLNEIIETHLGSGVNLKKATAYHLLNKMKEEQWISCSEEKQGNRPTRRVYIITKKGEDTFQKLLRENLAQYAPVVSPSQIGLAFLPELPVAEALQLIHLRRDTIRRIMQNIEDHDGLAGRFQLLHAYQKRHLSAELDWLDELIDQLNMSTLSTS